MDILAPNALLGGLAPQTFMRRHWQKKPLLVRRAVPGGVALVSRAELFDLAGSDAIESRLIEGHAGRWSLRRGPFRRSAIPPLKRPHWTLLVQGMDLHVGAARTLLERFRFVPDARLDDLMMSYASDGGGVGPHVDSYDVFLLQAHGRRRWRIGKAHRPQLVPDLPLKILANFEAEHSFLLEAGDMLYLPPGWGHDGVAEGPCMTCSIGFRAPGRDEIAREVLQRMLDGTQGDGLAARYRDPRQAATPAPARIPAALQAFAAESVARWVADADSLACALGEMLTEPKQGVWFDAAASRALAVSGGLSLSERTRMLYDDAHVFVNGEAFRASGRDAALMRRLADRRALGAPDVDALSGEARALVDGWLDAGWLRRDGTMRCEKGAKR